MHIKVLWLRIAHWAGIIADAIVAILMVFPERYVRFYNLDLILDATLKIFGSLGFCVVLKAGVPPAPHIQEQYAFLAQIRGVSAQPARRVHTPFEQFTPRNPRDPDFSNNLPQC
jgi:hypothetical protein